MEKKNRRTLHQVWCDREDAEKEHIDDDYVWYQGKVYYVNTTHYTGELFLESLDKKDIVHMDVDMLNENCFEVFEKELRTIKVLYSSK